MIERILQDYILKRTKGICTISFQDARHIVNLVTGKIQEGFSRAELSRYNGTNGHYELIRIIQTTDEAISKAIREALEVGPVNNFYRYDLYNAAGEFEGRIFTVKNNLF